MARQQIVSRNVKIYTVKALIYNATTKDSEDFIIEIPRDLKTENALLKYISKIYPSPQYRVIAAEIIDSRTEQRFMTPEDFIKYSTIM